MAKAEVFFFGISAGVGGGQKALCGGGMDILWNPYNVNVFEMSLKYLKQTANMGSLFLFYSF